MTRPRTFHVFIVGSLFAATTALPIPGEVAAGRSTPPDARQTGSQQAAGAFVSEAALSGLTEPIAVRFSPDGRIFVAEKPGIVKIFDSMADTTPTTFVDIRREVYSFLDHGLLGMALDPSFPQQPYVYLLYSRDAISAGGATPAWNDACDAPEGCISYSRLVRYQVNGNSAGPRIVLIDDWCKQFGSHATGALEFGADGFLYAGAGDGASYLTADWGQFGSPRNPCGDPPSSSGTGLTLPEAQGGSLRSQDARTTADPTGLSGAIIRVDPATGAAAPGNPFSTSSDINQRRIIAYGVRNPFRTAMRRGTNELFVGDVGWNYGDEIDRIANGADAVAENFGWPCYEGSEVLPAWFNLNATLCQSLYTATGSVRATNPVYEYLHTEQVVANEPCPPGASALSGLAFSRAGNYPAKYNGGLFFADYARQCIWFAPSDANGQPDFTRRETFMATPGHFPVDLQSGPGGELFYPDIVTGEVMRSRYVAGNQAPISAVTASPSVGAAPLSVTVDARDSTDPDPGETATLQFAWDLDDDGAFDDGSGLTQQVTLTTVGIHTLAVRATDVHGASSIATTSVRVGTSPQLAVAITNAAWKVGDLISFTGSATDSGGVAIDPANFTWRLRLQHCDARNQCHAHALATIAGSAMGSVTAPDHALPAYLEVELSARDDTGLASTLVRRLNPSTTTLTVQSLPPGLTTLIDGVSVDSGTAFQVIKGSRHVLTAKNTQVAFASRWYFERWSDSPAQSRTYVVGNVPANLDVRYQSPNPAQYRILAIDGSTATFGITTRTMSVSAFSQPRPWIITGAATPDGKGWWRADSEGRVYAAGAARHYGDTSALALRQPVVAMAATPTGRGYWLTAADGGVFSFGDARFAGSLGNLRLNQPIVAMTATRSGRGYWLTAADGGIFSFGDAHFFGSLGGKAITSPIRAMIRTRSGNGYWMLAANGKVHRFGDAANYGSTAALGSRIATSLRITPSGNGYWILDNTGGVYPFGDAPRLGGATSFAIRIPSFSFG